MLGTDVRKRSDDPLVDGLVGVRKAHSKAHVVAYGLDSNAALGGALRVKAAKETAHVAHEPPFHETLGKERRPALAIAKDTRQERQEPGRRQGHLIAEIGETAKLPTGTLQPQRCGGKRGFVTPCQTGGGKKKGAM